MKKIVIWLRLLLVLATLLISGIVVGFYAFGVGAFAIEQYPVLGWVFCVGVTLAFASFYAVMITAWQYLTQALAGSVISDANTVSAARNALAHATQHLAQALFALVGGALIGLPMIIALTIQQEALAVLFIYIGVIGLPLLLGSLFWLQGKIGARD
ncbi:hypothetical protein [Lacticaseibacillus mingshuiensis]|uniref:Uncharacterized protein n=1 Tax=Lacticaseibacillus mingshuiensis TaxID=2799574 RepID=A0ABW4CK82_9LACO|nr:hypothetical protein [Lacticaseibacillus mingshuiensis]